jgi:hypothetical protein
LLFQENIYEVMRVAMKVTNDATSTATSIFGNASVNWLMGK